MCFHYQYLQKSTFSESVDLKKQKKNKNKNIHNHVLEHATYNTAAKFQEKIINPTLFGVPGSFCFLSKRNGFW